VENEIGIEGDLKIRDPEMKEEESHLRRDQGLQVMVPPVDHLGAHLEEMMEVEIQSTPTHTRVLKRRVKKKNIVQEILWRPPDPLREVFLLAEPGKHVVVQDLAEPGHHLRRLRQ